MKNIFKVILVALVNINVLAHAQNLNWPSDGGIESWGLAKVDGCQPGDGYMEAFSNKFSSIYLIKPWSGSTSTARQYVNSGQVKAFIDKIRLGGLNSPEGKALSDLVDNLNRENIKFRETAGDYLKLIAGGGSPERVVTRIRSFELSDNSCSPGGRSPSASGSILCGLAAQMAGHTIKLENAIQIACHAGLRVPVYHSSSNINILNKSSDSGTQGTFPINNNSAYSNQNQSTQPQNQQAQQQSQQAQQSAQQTQARADQQRQGKRKTNDPAAQAHNCIEIDKAGSGNFGAFKNTCNFKVNFSTCNYKPKIISGGFNWSADFNCEKQQYGLHTPGAGQSVAAHNRNTEMVYWFACKAPATPVDAEFVVGKGIEARCHN